jgi:hypothetical protein
MAKLPIFAGARGFGWSSCASSLAHGVFGLFSPRLACLLFLRFPIHVKGEVSRAIYRFFASSRLRVSLFCPDGRVAHLRWRTVLATFSGFSPMTLKSPAIMAGISLLLFYSYNHAKHGHNITSPERLIMSFSPLPRSPRIAPARPAGRRRFPGPGCRGRAGRRNLPGFRPSARTDRG